MKGRCVRYPTVQPSPYPLGALSGGRRGNRIGPLDRIAALIESSPWRGGLRLADRAETALVELGIGGGVEPERVDGGAGVGRNLARTPARRRLAGGVEGGQRPGRRVGDV